MVIEDQKDIIVASTDSTANEHETHWLTKRAIVKVWEENITNIELVQTNNIKKITITINYQIEITLTC